MAALEVGKLALGQLGQCGLRHPLVVRMRLACPFHQELRLLCRLGCTRQCIFGMLLQHA